jgi:hypothetical protein
MVGIAGAVHGIDLNKPFEALPERTQNLLLFGDAGKSKTGFQGVIGYLKQMLEQSSRTAIANPCSITCRRRNARAVRAGACVRKAWR